ncbi:hypothetical protein CHUAL_011789 [Chamberlinius hualienensis]
MAVCLLRRACFGRLSWKLILANERCLVKPVYSFRPYTNKNLVRLHERGLLEEVFPDVSAKVGVLLSKESCIYAGFDPTADSLHVGNLVVLMVLLHAQRAGHNVIALIGGATSQIGDPTDRVTEREVIDSITLDKNINGIRNNLSTLFNHHQQFFWTPFIKDESLPPIKILNNTSWYSQMSAIDFFSTVGKKFRMVSMLRKQSVQSRLNSADGMSFAEFAYQAFQAYDWLHLYDKYNCLFQVGGIDQKGNVTTGHDLLNRVRKVQSYGLFVPLVKSETGSKIGKTTGTPIWLDPLKTSPFEFYQHFLRVTDADVESNLKLYTFLSVAEIKTLMDNHMKAPESRKAQKKLAELVTLLVHGENGLKSALRTTNILYNGTPDLLAKLSEEELEQVFQHASSVSLILNPGTTILQMLLQAKCVGSEGDARSFAKVGAVTINYRKVENLDYVLIPGEHILPNNHTLVKVGKRNYYLIRWMQ